MLFNLLDNKRTTHASNRIPLITSIISSTYGIWYCEVELIPLWKYDTSTHYITYCNYVWYCEVELIPLWEYDTSTHYITYVWYCEVELIPLWEYDTSTHYITYVWYCEVELIPLWKYDISYYITRITSSTVPHHSPYYGRLPYR